MTAAERLDADAALAAQDDWSTPGLAELKLDPQQAALHADAAADALAGLSTLIGQLNRTLPGARQHLDEAYPDQTGQLHVELTDKLQQAHRELGQLISIMEVQTLRRAAGEGVLPDGRTYRVGRGAQRRSWDRDAYERDVDRQLLSGLDGHVLYDQDGTAVDLRRWAGKLLAGAHKVHGSVAPRVAQLRGLGLSAGDYCETLPGKPSVRVFQPGQEGAEAGE